MNAAFRSGKGPTTQIGYINCNHQENHGTRGRPGNDHNQDAFRLECLDCGHCYGANGTDIHHRKCPQCQGGATGIEY